MSDDYDKIMVVDDDMDTAALVKYVAHHQGLFITIQKGGLSALKFLHEMNYEVDAIIIDLSMPDMDGITLTKQIRQNENLRSKTNPSKIFWFTAWPFDENNPYDPIVLGASDAHVEKIYSKPADLLEVMRDVKHTLGMPRENSGSFPAGGTA
jgi:CheY-like chemotaxis protein